jgi:carboxypeptidase C (cathepsin A)
MIYVDQPIGTGFSYSDPEEFLTSMDGASAEFVTFMVNLYEMYPEFKGRPLYMTGESYAGKYLPRYSNALLDSNAANATQFNLMGTLVGDPYTAPLTQRTSMYKIPYALNIIDDSNMRQISAMTRRCQEMISINLTQAADDCSNIMGYIEEVAGDPLPYDNRIFGYDWDPIEAPVLGYFSEANPDAAALWTALHVDGSPKTPKFQMGNSKVGNAF